MQTARQNAVFAPTCDEKGYTRHTCSNCFDTYTTNEVAALGHSYTYTDNGSNHVIGCKVCSYNAQAAHTYVDGSCVCGAVDNTEPEAEVDKNLKFTMNIGAGAEMTVSYNVFAAAVSKYTDFYLEVAKDTAGGEPTVVTYGVSEGHNPFVISLHPTTGAPLIYSATFTGISAKEMGDNFVTTLYAVDAEGKLYRGEPDTDSIKNFLVSKLTDEKSTTELKTMAVDMLKYGEAAQILFGYGTDNLVTADLTAEQLAYATAGVPEATDTSGSTGDGANVTANVTVGSRVELGLSMFKIGIADPSTVRCEIRDLKGNLLAEPEVTCSNGMIYGSGYNNVGAREMRQPITATFFDGETQISKTLTWSVESYVAQTRANEKSTEADINMVNAMLTYGDSVGAYLTSIGQ